jgi:hypothetical protein
MRCVYAVIVVALAVSLTGCMLKGRQQTVKATPPPAATIEPPPPPPPPAKLSIPQTNVELPPPQPVNLDALVQTQPPEEPPAATPPAKGPRRAAAAPKTEPVSTQGPAPPPPAAAPEANRPPIQEILTPSDLKQFQDRTATARREVRKRLDGRQANGAEKELIDRIASFMKQSEEAEGRADWRQASELAERALALARELTGGK